jgi:hypothetical protein
MALVKCSGGAFSLPMHAPDGPLDVTVHLVSLWTRTDKSYDYDSFEFRATHRRQWGSSVEGYKPCVILANK